MAEFVSVPGGATLEQGTLRAFDVGGESVALASVEGTLYAFDDLCPHRQCSLAEGRLEGAVVTCPCHGSQFDVTTGERLRGPAVGGVQAFAVRIMAGDLQVEIGRASCRS